MTDYIRIVTPENASALGTKVFTSGGDEIKHITAIEFKPMVPGGLVTAVVTLAVGRCDIKAHPLLSLESLRAAADAHGYRVEKGRLTPGKNSVEYT